MAETPQTRPRPTLAEKLWQAENLTGILKVLGIPRNEWDYVLIGDGSGTGWEKPSAAGWSCLEIENGTFTRKLHFGGANRGTNILCEMMAYLYPLLELSERDVRRSDDMGFSRVHVITDCEYVKQLWQKKHRRKSHKAAWAAFDVFSRLGIILTFHWIPRDTIDSNRLCHDLANSARRALKDPIHLEYSLQRREAESIYDIDPS